MKTIRTVLVDDDHRYRSALRAALDIYPDIEVVGSFGDGAAVVDAAVESEGQPWDVALMDIDMPRMDGLEATRRLKAMHPTVAIVVLSVFEDPHVVVRAICQGADGYVLKDTLPQALVEHLRIAVAGGSPLTPGIAGAVLDIIRKLHVEQPRLDVKLSRREKQVLEELVQGRSYKQVAAALGIGLETVRTYIRSLYKKLQVHNVAEAVSVALRHRMV
ncbi:MAG: response regulator transcription factor [Deltaproteobacteria bacterium]|nr:response regulator transcription factor [Deltaproteobacteria bacterium]